MPPPALPLTLAGCGAETTLSAGSGDVCPRRAWPEHSDGQTSRRWARPTGMSVRRQAWPRHSNGQTSRRWARPTGGLSVAERGGAHLLGGQATRSPRFGCGSPTWVRVTLDSRAIRTQVSGSHPTREPAAGPADSTPVSVEGGRRSEAVVRSPRTTASVWPGSLQVAAQPSGLTPAAAASRPGHAPW